MPLFLFFFLQKHVNVYEVYLYFTRLIASDENYTILFNKKYNLMTLIAPAGKINLILYPGSYIIGNIKHNNI